MKNMKKIIGLLLVMATLICLCTVGVSASCSLMYYLYSNDGSTLLYQEEISGNAGLFEIEIVDDTVNYILSGELKGTYTYNRGKKFMGLASQANAKVPVLTETKGFSMTVPDSASSSFMSITQYLVECDVNTVIWGESIPNATSYVLCSKSGSTYTELATANELYFDLTKLNFAAGEHTLTVKAKADGYADSAYSNEILYRVTKKLTRPILTNRSTSTQCIFSFSNDTNANYYVLYANGNVIPSAAWTPTLAAGVYTVSIAEAYFTAGVSYSITVKAIANSGSFYEDSDMSASFTFMKSEPITQTFTVEDGIDNGGVLYDEYPTLGQNFTCTVWARADCTLPASVRVWMSGEELSSSGYSYNAKTGSLTVYNVTGNVGVSGTCLSDDDPDAQKLTKPVLTNQSTSTQCIFSFTNDTNADYYVFYANGNMIPSVAWTPTLTNGVYTITVNSAYFTAGTSYSIIAKAVAKGGTNFVDSDYSDPITFTK